MMVMTKLFLALAALSAPLVAASSVTTIASAQFTLPSGMAFTSDAEYNTKVFATWIKTSEFKTLKDLIVKKGGSAGVCTATKPQPLPAQVEWTHGVPTGACEVWCDDEMVFHGDNCPTKVPYDKTKCVGKKQLATYWLALQSPVWQVYVDCAAIDSATSPTPANSTPTVTPMSVVARELEAEADCAEELPEPECTDDLPEPDCADDLPEPAPKPAAGGNGGGGGGGAAADADCDQDLPEPDCAEDLPEPNSRMYNQPSYEGFEAINQNGGEEGPANVKPSNY